MILNFKNRREAREYCWKWEIPLKNIRKVGTGSHPWRVSSVETVFAVGKDYKLIDVEGFTNNGKNTSNKIQSKQINEHLNGVISIIGREGDRLKFKVPAGVVMNIVRPWEAIYFKEVKATPAKAPKPAKQPKPAPAAKDKTAPAVPDLDDELNGGINLAPVAKPAVQPTAEMKPDHFIENVAYVLVDEKGFLASHGTNKNIVYHIKNNNDIVIFECVDTDGDAVIKGHTELPFVMHRERKFFRELGTGKPALTPAPAVQTVDIVKQQRDQEIMEAVLAVEDALAEHQKAIEVVTKKARAVREAAAKLALLARK